jgi:peptidyl-prolyl cis-trans isomerase B (cyclophilin B)
MNRTPSRKAARVSGSKERQRRLARERFERQQQRRVEHQHKIRQRTAIAGSAVAVVAIAVGAYFLFGVGSSKPSASATSKPAASASPSPSPTKVILPPATPLAAVPKGAPKTAPATHCTYKPKPPAARNVGTPPAKPDSSAKSQATIVTNRGTVVVDLLNSRAPCTVNSFVYLAKKGYFNNTPCPRLVNTGIYVLQCGDPTGTGQGGPGYGFGIENAPKDGKYAKGVLAMARTQDPNSNGGQFFITYKETQLPTDGGGYTIFGKVTKGLDIVEKIAANKALPPSPQDGTPVSPISILSVSVTEKKA